MGPSASTRTPAEDAATFGGSGSTDAVGAVSRCINSLRGPRIGGSLCHKGHLGRRLTKVDPRNEAVLLAEPTTGEFEDKTRDVVTCQEVDGRVLVNFRTSRTPYSYGAARARVLRPGVRLPIPEGSRVEVHGQVWVSVTEVWTFTGPQDAWSHVFYRRGGEEVFAAYPATQVQVVTGAEQAQAAAAVLNYWRTLVSRLPSDDPLRRPFDGLGFIHPQSALARYLTGAPIETRELSGVTIFPFRCNLSQRKAVDLALTRSVDDPHKVNVAVSRAVNPDAELRRVTRSARACSSVPAPAFKCAASPRGP